jgi:hypothetical protein
MIAFMHKFREFPPELRDMLLSNEINKVGLEVEGDLKRLRTEYGLQYGAFVDVGRAVKRIFDAKVNGLARVGKYILNVDLPKPRHVTMSNWERYPLTMEQIRYAAHDALIGACIFDQMKTMAPIAMTFFDVCEEKYRLYNLYVEEDNEHMSTRFVKEMQKTKNVTPPATSAQALFEQALASGVSSDNTFNPLTDNVSLGSSTALPASDNVNNEQPDRILGLLDRNAIKNKCFQIIKESSWGQHRFSELLYNSDIAWISKNSECLLQPIASVDGISGWRWSQVTYVWTCKLTHLLHPDDWFSFWRLNCQVVSYHSLARQTPGYKQEDKWTFLKDGHAMGVPVSPFLELQSIVCKNKNIEGGMGIHFFKVSAMHPSV